MIDKVAVVILNYNGKHFLEQFLPSVTTFSSKSKIIVADNGSTDASISFLQTHYPFIQLIQLPENKGFSSGYNLALQKVEAEYYVLLNSDVEVTEHWIEPVIALMDQNPQIAACQPKIKSYHHKTHFEHAGAAGGMIDKYGYPFCRGRVFDEIEADEGQYNDEMQIFWATGACMFVRAKLYHELGGLDDDFFAHMEEIDLCWRLQHQGYQIWYVGKSEVYHVGGGTLPKSNPHKTYLNFHNNLAMLFKNLPSNRLYLVLFIKFFLDLLASVHFLKRRFYKDSWSILSAYFNFYKRIAYWKKKRKQISKLQKLPLILNKSIVWQYFIKKKKKFNEL